MSEAFEEPGFDMGLPPPPAAATAPSGGQAYRVLARKYRPQKFSELIGQDAMVQTLANAIKRERLAHAFLMTGVRGVGKTTTARLIAKALNCIGADGKGGPTIDPCNLCEPCVAIAEGRHIDVVEMDAASNTGVDDVREIIEAVRYSAVSARYKVYIIDEVHMLTKNAFNALLKTLEEPPPHVKFLFATTEINKVPITVLSRCQRFDLRRIPADQLAAHFANVVKAEEIEAESEALALVARAAEGSVRDGLSILDQAIAHADMDSGGRVTANQLRAMLGLSDRGAIRRLAGLILAADGPAVLAALAEQHVLGVDPLAVMGGLMDTVHGITRAKVGAPFDPSQSAEEREAIEGWSSDLSFILLHRLWQMLLKGHQEVARASDPQMAAEMALLRLVHASSLPDPAELARTLAGGGAVVLPQKAGAQTVAAAAPDTSANMTAPADYPALVDALEVGGKLVLADQLRREFGLVSYAPPALVLRPLRPQSDPQFVAKLNLAIREVLGEGWRAEFSDAASALSLSDQEAHAETELRAAVMATPLVAAAFEAFPEAELVGYEGDPRKVAQ